LLSSAEVKNLSGKGIIRESRRYKNMKLFKKGKGINRPKDVRELESRKAFERMGILEEVKKPEGEGKLEDLFTFVDSGQEGVERFSKEKGLKGDVSVLQWFSDRMISKIEVVRFTFQIGDTTYLNLPYVVDTLTSSGIPSGKGFVYADKDHLPPGAKLEGWEVWNLNRTEIEGSLENRVVGTYFITTPGSVSYKNMALFEIVWMFHVATEFFRESLNAAINGG
jgi:hypothetical protein